MLADQVQTPYQVPKYKSPKDKEKILWTNIKKIRVYHQLHNEGKDY